MRTVYLDELFALNLVIDYFLLLATAKLCALPFRRVRFALSAALGALTSCLALVPALSFLSRPAMHPVLAMGMTLIAFGGERRLWRCFFAFLGISMLFGGAVWAAGLYRGAIPGAGALVRVDMRVLAVSFALCWALVSFLFRRSAKSAAHRTHEIVLEKNGRTVRFRALEDSGNGLYDPLTGRSALVVEARAVEDLFPQAQAAALRGGAVEAAMGVPGMRLIPYAGVEGGRGLLPAFLPDRVTVDGVERDDLLAAVAPGAMGGDNYEGII